MEFTIAIKVEHREGPELTEDQVAGDVAARMLGELADLWIFPVGSPAHSEYEITGTRKVEGLMDMGTP